MSAPMLEPPTPIVHIVDDCHGHNWLALPSQNAIWVLASDDRDEVLADIADALDALYPPAGTRPRLRLVR
jgi:hypothetical protein